MDRLLKGTFGAIVILYVIGALEENKELRAKNRDLKMAYKTQRVIIDIQQRLLEKKEA